MDDEGRIPDRAGTFCINRKLNYRENLKKVKERAKYGWMPVDTYQHPTKPGYFNRYYQVNIPTEYKKTKPDILELFQKYKRPVVVCGGGPSLPDDLFDWKIQQEPCLYISCNHHAFQIIDPDYMVFLDKVYGNKNKNFIKVYESATCPRISVNELDHTDYYTVLRKPWHPGDTGCFGLWVACYITSGPVYLCGMDLRDGDKMHFYDSGALYKTPEYKKMLPARVLKWAVAHKACHKPERIRAISGPLKEIFK